MRCTTYPTNLPAAQLHRCGNVCSLHTGASKALVGVPPLVVLMSRVHLMTPPRMNLPTEFEVARFGYDGMVPVGARQRTHARRAARTQINVKGVNATCCQCIISEGSVKK